uniref:SRCR domain-containing protein n=1 Tax=Callorhinchus milii TaxID=7868 RepID=A0A4W3GML5_CALMI
AVSVPCGGVSVPNNAGLYVYGSGGSGWDMLDAAVVCKELGCGAALYAPGGAHFGEGSGPIVTLNVQCRGSESTMSGCQSLAWGHYSWSHASDTGVICLALHKASHSHPCTTLLQVCILQYVSLLLLYPGSGKRGGVFVRLVGMGGGVITLLVRACLLLGLHVVSNSLCLQYNDYYCCCIVYPQHPPNLIGPLYTYIVLYFPGLLKSVMVRLVNGSSPCAGRVEVSHSNQWGTVYGYGSGDNGWDMEDAAVVCKELGCGAALSASGNAHFGRGSGPVVKFNVQCRGRESALRGCPSQTWCSNSTSHSYDAGVICSGKQFILYHFSDHIFRNNVKVCIQKMVVYYY